MRVYFISVPDDHTVPIEDFTDVTLAIKETDDDDDDDDPDDPDEADDPDDHDLVKKLSIFFSLRMVQFC